MMNRYNIERICTSSAETALTMAREEANSLGHEVDARHLMLGLLKEGKGIGAKHLNHMKVDAQSIRNLVKDFPNHPARFQTRGVEQFLERAFEECARLGHEYIGSEHLLLSILADSENLDFFRTLNVNPSSARTNLLQLLGH